MYWTYASSKLQFTMFDLFFCLSVFVHQSDWLYVNDVRHIHILYWNMFVLQWMIFDTLGI